MWGCYGGSLPALIWRDFMASSLPPATAAHFPTVANQRPVMLRLCSKSNLKAGPKCKHSYAIRFDPAAAPGLCKGEEIVDKPAVALGDVSSEVPVVRRVVNGVPTYSNTEPVSLAGPLEDEEESQRPPEDDPDSEIEPEVEAAAAPDEQLELLQERAER